MTKIAVIGSINIDYVVETDVLPTVGETVLAKNFFHSPGGKGANQAVAIARLGGEVELFGSVGLDENGAILVKNLEAENVKITNLQYVNKVPTGVAVIEICQENNRILVVQGANNYTNINYLQNIKEHLLTYDTFLFQFETPIEILEYLIPILHERKKIVIVNPAPSFRLRKHLIHMITYITPNEHEYQTLFNTKLPYKDILKQYPNKCIITRGEKGVVYHNGIDLVTIPSLKVEPIDTTGAGDTFSGAFALAIAEGKSLYESIQFGNIAAGISVTKSGAQGGMPYRNKLDQQLMKEVKRNEDKDLFQPD